MNRIDFNGGWTVAHLGDEENARPVMLPHDAMLSEPRANDSPGGTNTGWFAAKDYVYFKEFDAPTDAAYLDFEGVYHRAEIYLDGKRMESHPNGYFGFHVPVSAGRHDIRVIARNAKQPSSRWYTGAGMYRPVTLVCLPEKHILPDSIHVRTLDAATKTIDVSFETNARGAVRVEIDGQAQTGESPMRFTLPSAVCWSPETPRLYTAKLTFEQDVQEARFGIRTVDLDAARGLLINGKRTLLLGACVHHDHGILGAAAYPCAERRKIELLKKAGYNAVRFAHNPASRALLDACDELGIFALDEYADMWYTHKTEYDYADYFESNWENDLKELVMKDRNHPSVILYSIGNEVAETARGKGIALAERMCKLLHSLDDRPVTCAINPFFNYLSRLGFGVYSDKKALAAAKAAESGKRNKKKSVGSEFINNIAGTFGAGFMKFGTTLRGSDVFTRGAFQKLDAAGYNYGVRRYRRDLKKYPDRVILGSETFCFDAMPFYTLAQAHPALIGDFVWAGMDYLGEVGLGAWEYADNAPRFDKGAGWIAAGTGVLDLVGSETGQTAYTQVAFGISPVRIAVEPVCFSGQKRSRAAWRMTNAVESWSWNGSEGKRAKVFVYTKAPFAELKLNGRTIGRKRTNKLGVARFALPYAAGELSCAAFDAHGKQLAQTRLQSAGDDTVLRLIPERERVGAGELIYVHARYTDAKGVLKPAARGKVRLSVTGGELLAFGNACAYNENGYLSDYSETYYGEAVAVIRARETVVLRAESPYGAAELTVRVTAVMI